MQVTQIDADGLKRGFKVVIPADHLEMRMSERLAEIARTVQIAGFRPGKVPLKLVRKKYGPAVLGEVMEKAVNDGTQSAITEHNLRPAVQPKVEITSYAEGADLEIKVELEVMPEIVPMDFGLLSLEREKAAVADAEVAEALERIAAQHGGAEPVKRAAKDGDVLLIDFVGKQDGVAFTGGSAENYELKLGSNTFIPGFEAQLIGAKAGTDTEVTVTFPDSYGNAELAGKPAVFEVKVREVRQPKAAVIDEDFAKSLGVESLDALKQSVGEEIGRELDGLARARLKRKLLDQLAAHHDFPVPVSMVDQEFEAIWKQLDEDRAAGRLDPADAGKSEDELKAEYRALSERRVRLGLLLADVGRTNHVAVSQEDLNRALMNEARRFPGQEHMVFQYYRSNPEALDGLRAPLFEEKVIDFILELAKVADKEVSAEELRRDPDSAEAEPKAEAKPKKRAAKKKTAE